MTVGLIRAVVPTIPMLIALGCVPTAEAPVVVLQVAAPSEPPATQVAADQPEEVPFVGGQVWTGTYVCSQGETALWLRIFAATGNDVSATFEFEHVPSGAHGEYELLGRYDPHKRTLVLTPGRWLSQPPNYISVGMSGRVSSDGKRFQGKITEPSCGTFTVALGG